MKVIDLINKMVNGEEVPKKIKFEEDIYEYDNRANDYLFYSDDNFNRYLIQDTLYELWQYGEEVEIIEEDKKDNFTGWKMYQDGREVCSMDCSQEEDNKIDHLSYEETSLWVDDEDGKKPVEIIVAINNKELVNKINEIIDEVNKLKDDRK